jgi:hypothetical protein
LKNTVGYTTVVYKGTENIHTRTIHIWHMKLCLLFHVKIQYVYCIRVYKTLRESSCDYNLLGRVESVETMGEMEFELFKQKRQKRLNTRYKPNKVTQV